MIIYSIFDKVSCSYSNPYVGKNIDVVKRDLKTVIPENPMYFNNLDDFDLVLLGTFLSDVHYPISLAKETTSVSFREIFGKE